MVCIYVNAAFLSLNLVILNHSMSDLWTRSFLASPDFANTYYQVSPFENCTVFESCRIDFPAIHIHLDIECQAWWVRYNRYIFATSQPEEPSIWTVNLKCMGDGRETRPAIAKYCRTSWWDNRNLSTGYALCPMHPRACIIIYCTWTFACVAVVRSGHA